MVLELTNFMKETLMPSRDPKMFSNKNKGINNKGSTSLLKLRLKRKSTLSVSSFGSAPAVLSY